MYLVVTGLHCVRDKNTKDKLSPAFSILGVSEDPIQLKKLERRSQKLAFALLKLLAKPDECSPARAHKISATARMLGFWLKFPYGIDEKPYAP